MNINDLNCISSFIVFGPETEVVEKLEVNPSMVEGIGESNENKRNPLKLS